MFSDILWTPVARECHSSCSSSFAGNRESSSLAPSDCSGRRLSYIKPRLTTNRFGSTSVEYDGVLPTKKWGAIESYGGKFTENVVQAIARDLLTHALHTVANAGHRIVMHVHDEIVVETETATVDEICTLMATAPAWATGLPLDADGYECVFYQKD